MLTPAELHALSPALFYAATALLGLVTGSFLNVVVHRLPIMLERDWRRQCEDLLGQPETGAGAGTASPPHGAADEPFDLVRPRSHCPACGHPVAVRDNIPVLSWLWLRGRCRACGARISARYPVVELLTALLSVAVVWHFGPTLAALGALLLTWSLVALAFIDLDHHLLPDSITLPVLWLGLLLNLGAVYAPVESAVIGAAAGYGVLWLVFMAFKWATGKEGMGFGDFKLLALFGAWLGWQDLPLILVLATVAGAAIGVGLIATGRQRRDQPIPFGPFLALAGWIALMWGDEISRAYLRWSGLA